MTISFNNVPSNLRVPFVAVEIDNSRASKGPALLAYRGLLIGQKLPSGTGSANTLHKVSKADDVLTLAGRGSMLHRMALAWFATNKGTETYIGILSDNSAGVAATGSLLVSGTATAAGTINLYVGGSLVQVAVASGDSASTIASAIAEEIGKYAAGTVTFGTPGASDNVTVGATTFIGTAGAVTPGAATYSVDTSGAAAATSLAAQINAHAVASTVVVASANSTVVTLTARDAGEQGNSIVLTTTDAVNAAVSGSGTLSGATEDTDLPVRATVSSATVTVHHRHKGAVGNEIDLRYNYQVGEALPAGVSLSVTAMASGATNPVLTSLISAMGDNWYQVIAHPYTDATSLTALETELADRFLSTRMIDGVAITCKSAELSPLGTLGDSRNSPHSAIVASDHSPTATYEIAAAIGASVAAAGAADPARPFQTLPLAWVKAPSEADRFTMLERNTLLHDGISTMRVGAGDLMQIERLCTTYQRNAAGASDTSYYDVTTMLTLLYLRYSFRNQILSRYPRHKLADDTFPVSPGQAVITPKIGKAEAVLWFQQMLSLGLVENAEQFQEELVVERNALDRNRLDFLLPPDLMNQFVVGAVNMQFRL